jgi:ribonuclease Z
VQGETIALADGTVITPDQVLGEEVPGVKLVHIGDVGRTDKLHEVVAGADALVIEATFLDEDVEIAKAFGHLTARQAATFAVEAGAKALILTHVSRRYRERDIIEEARSVFPDTFVARDFDHFVIHRDRPIEKKQASHQHE